MQMFSGKWVLKLIFTSIKTCLKQKSGIGFAPFAQHKGKMLPLEKSLN
jgi:hypothetical protein